METNPGPRRPVIAVCRILCSNARDLAGNLRDVTVSSPRYDILLCCETLVSDMRHVSELRVPGFGRPGLLCGLGPDGWRDTYEMDTNISPPLIWDGCYEMTVLGVVVRDRTTIYSVFTATLT